MRENNNVQRAAISDEDLRLMRRLHSAAVYSRWPLRGHNQGKKFQLHIYGVTWQRPVEIPPTRRGKNAMALQIVEHAGIERRPDMCVRKK